MKMTANLILISTDKETHVTEVSMSQFTQSLTTLHNADADAADSAVDAALGTAREKTIPHSHTYTRIFTFTLTHIPHSY